MACVVGVLLAIVYGVGVVAVRRKGERWSGWLVAAFYLLGIGSFLAVNFGFLGRYSYDLRWAFSTRTALLLFVTPALLALGRPVTLARKTLGQRGADRIDRFMATPVIKFLGNAVVEPFVTVLIFAIFLTPIAGVLRLSPFGQAGVTILIPAIGLLLVLPLIEYSSHRTAFFVTVEFLLAFVALIVDAIPGIVIRLSGTVLDGLGRAAGAHPAWYPNPLRDQQLSGDLLWFIAELADVPVLIILFVRWTRIDRKEAKSYDDLTDEQMDALTQEHLRRRGN
ncbi:MAG TPA: cytochrome c oxidase assembly protein [Galbitalea sp.]|nr:cytochrome c oxidase assembly protein [Galbitalea sp.]